MFCSICDTVTTIYTGVGTFYEGAMTASYTTDAADAALQANIVAAGYGK